MIALSLARKAILPLALGAIAGGALARVAAAQGQPRLSAPHAYQRLDSLQAAALTGATLRDRLNAVLNVALITMGQPDCTRGPASSAIKYPGVVSRLATIYRQSRDPNVREFTLYRMPFMPECDEAVAFLATAAEEAPPPPTPVPPGVAIITDDLGISLQMSAVDLLADFGPRGEAALRRLHAQATVRDSAARARLDGYARKGFRRGPPQ